LLPPTGSGSGLGTGLLIQTSQGREFCACGTGTMDVSLFFFIYFPGRSSKKRIQMIDNKQRPIDGGGVHLASKTGHF
jgi:hypothetical protein